jgi:hypothetical protein
MRKKEGQAMNAHNILIVLAACGIVLLYLSGGWLAINMINMIGKEMIKCKSYGLMKRLKK